MRVVVASWLGSTNLGDEILFRALTRQLAARGVTPVAISIDVERTRSLHRVEAVHHTDAPGLWAAVGDADALLLGGGDLVQDVTSAFTLPYHLARVGLARARRRPVAAVGLGAPTLVRSTSATMLNRAWPAGAPVAVRDAESAATLRSVGIEPIVAADLAFSLPSPSHRAPDDAVAVCLRAWHGGGTRPVAGQPVATDRPVPDAADEAMVTATAQGLDRLAAQTGLPLRFIGMQPDRDGVFHERVIDRLQVATARTIGLDGDSEAAVGQDPIERMVDAITRCRMVVATRFHAGVVAVLGQRPVVMLSYADKVASLARRAADHARTVGGSPTLTALAWSPAAVAGLGEAATSMLDATPDGGAFLAALREAEAGNGRVLDQLLEVVAARR